MQRWSKESRIIIACAILLAALDIYVRFATAPKETSSSVVTTQELRLTDSHGNIRALMKTDASGEPGLMMFDKNGTLRMQLDSFETTPSLSLMDQDGNRRAYYGMSDTNGDGELTFTNPNKDVIARILIKGDGSSFSFRNEINEVQSAWNSENIVNYSQSERP